MSVAWFIGPYYFDEPVVNAGSYSHLLNNFFLSMLLSAPLAVSFQPDGARRHYSRKARALFDGKVPHTWIWRSCPANWTACSRDLTLLDSFFWGYVRNRVYSTHRPNVTQLGRHIISAIHIARVDVLQNAWEPLHKALISVVRQKQWSNWTSVDIIQSFECIRVLFQKATFIAVQ